MLVDITDKTADAILLGRVARLRPCHLTEGKEGGKMIRVNDDWIVDIDEYNYTLKKDLHKLGKSKDKKTMVPQYKTVGYFSTLAKALERLGGEMFKEGLRDGEKNLAEACRTIRETKNVWQSLVDEVRRAGNDD